MSQAIISVENLGKKYRIKHQSERQRYTSLRDVIADRARRIFSRRQPSAARSSTSEDFWALKDVSFEVKQGEVVGIIGRNGAGKSTLLKILSRITEPTEGQVTLRGRVASLLEVGTGFHPELTGRENIFLNGAILGMQRAEIVKKFDEIVAFAEVEKFLDTPVKRYSSGMYVRLAFAVAAHLEPEILIVDEVLAVGDVEFQKKCLGKMQSVAAEDGRTVLFVTHNMAAVRALCTRGLCLHAGGVRQAGEVEQIISNYMVDTRVNHRRKTGSLIDNPDLQVRTFQFEPAIVESGDSVQFCMEFVTTKATRVSELALLLYHSNGSRIAVVDFRGCGVPRDMGQGASWRIRGEIASLPLVEGEISAGLYLNAGKVHENYFDLAGLTVQPRVKGGDRVPYSPELRGVVDLVFRVVA